MKTATRSGVMAIVLVVLGGAVGAQVAFQASKTVGTDPGVCATGPHLLLPPGNHSVTYCYTTRNLLNKTFSFSILDDKLGLMAINQSIDPFGTHQMMKTVNVLVSMTPVTNVANWTVRGQSYALETATVAMATAVPTLSDVAMIALGVILLGASLALLRNRAL